jgi:hypothetical protein
LQPIFLRAAHSPWKPLNQNALGYLRAAFVAYLIATAGMLLDYEIKHRPSEYSNWRIPFQFSAVTWFFLIVYHVLVFVSVTRHCPLRAVADSCLPFGSVMDDHAHALARY